MQIGWGKCLHNETIKCSFVAKLVLNYSQTSAKFKKIVLHHLKEYPQYSWLNLEIQLATIDDATVANCAVQFVIYICTYIGR